eukprot:gene2223-3427_t
MGNCCGRVKTGLHNIEAPCARPRPAKPEAAEECEPASSPDGPAGSGGAALHEHKRHRNSGAKRDPDCKAGRDSPACTTTGAATGVPSDSMRSGALQNARNLDEMSVDSENNTESGATISRSHPMYGAMDAASGTYTTFAIGRQTVNRPSIAPYIPRLDLGRAQCLQHKQAREMVLDEQGDDGDDPDAPTARGPSHDPFFALDPAQASPKAPDSPWSNGSPPVNGGRAKAALEDTKGSGARTKQRAKRYDSTTTATGTSSWTSGTSSSSSTYSSCSSPGLRPVQQITAGATSPPPPVQSLIKIPQGGSHLFTPGSNATISRGVSSPISEDYYDDPTLMRQDDDWGLQSKAGQSMVAPDDS